MIDYRKCTAPLLAALPLTSWYMVQMAQGYSVPLTHRAVHAEAILADATLRDDFRARATPPRQLL